MKNLLASALIFSALSALLPAALAAPATATEDRERILQIVDSYRNAIIKKDRDTFLKLFFGGAVPFIGVTTDQSLEWENANKRNASAPDGAKLYTSSNPKKFIDGIVNNPLPVEQTNDKVKIDTDGDVAQVWFDYTFIENGYKSNWGKQSWQMVRDKDGWKINAVIWSMEFNPAAPPQRSRK
ncbi:nuclear transport factor 2 family protein [Massilia sp. CF038]|uniref:nuclear transport factor 2 family protein n=1 Tax=Massilia sp. CF038 TaxID=1881045 RepID=UPI00091A02F1|nr:nuclear transport factor 2 family protein [Massilia sp. CF038]SHG97100.1 hypothetical protein SAMN05428948_2117 [Massilia sp. CF038]